MASKFCSKCNVTKSVNDFNRKSASHDGYQSHCKSCNVEINQIWNNNNRDHLNERVRNYIATNPKARISKNIHRILNHILKRGSYYVRTQEIIGLTKPQYLEWLSYNFENDMCFANYGELWQIDLVVPASAYDLTDEQQLLTAFNLRNIRPCLKSDNAAKYNFIHYFTIANQSIRVLGFIRKMRQIRIEHFLQNKE